MRWRVAVALVLLALPASLVIGQRQTAFPHERHANLFPLCQSCHAGIGTEDTTAFYPPPTLCARCHDGTRVREVRWTAPSRAPSNLDFSHGEHDAAARTAGDRIDCAGCHNSGPARMAVTGPDPALCAGCHAHAADNHFERGRDCAVCHVPLVDARTLSASRIEGFPTPEWHESPDFLRQDHPPRSSGDLVSCATCHARETCTRCHLNEQPAIEQLRPDPRVAALESEKRPEYPPPGSHALESWTWTHAAEARAGTSTCANCHVRSSCTACHTEATAADLPQAEPGDPRGVRLQDGGIRVHQPGWTRLHGVEAAASESCATCHGSAFCEQCHNAASSPVFHGPNFVARHAPDAYAQSGDCVSCHNPEVFCRACHAGLGMGSEGRLGIAFHTANPFWLVGHGVAARQGLEACASCHAQSTCMQCHSSLGSWRINPHGPGFDAGRLADASPVTCLLCHRSGAIRE